MPLAAWLFALIPGIIARILVSLGITIVTMVGIDTAIDALLLQFETSLNGLPADVLALLALSGIKQGLGIVVGAMLMKLSIWTFYSGSKMLFKNLS